MSRTALTSQRTSASQHHPNRRRPAPNRRQHRQRWLLLEPLEDRRLLATGAFDWAKTWGGASAPDGVYGTAADAAGNLYLAGGFTGTVDFDPDPTKTDVHTSNNGSTDAFFSKFDSSGHFLWARTWGGTGRDVAYGCGVDSAGSAYVVGPYRNTVDFDPNSTATALQTSNAGSENNIYVSKFSAAGDFQWVRAWGPSLVPGKQSFGAEAYHVAVAGNCLYVVGDFSGYQTDFNPWGSPDWHTNHAPASGTILWFDSFLSKFDLNGNFQWAKTWGGEGYDDGPGVAVDGLGNIYVAGMYASTNINFDPAGGSGGLGHPAHDSGSTVDVFLSKFDAGGNFQWVRTWGGQGTEDATGVVAVDGANNVYVAGRFASSNCDFNPGGTPDLHSTAGGLDNFLSKFDASGNFQWARTWGGTGADQANGLAVDGAGRVYVAGSFQKTVDFDPGSGTDLRTSHGKSDAWLSQLDPSGVFQWVQTWGGSDDDSAGVDVDGADAVYASGWFAGTSPVDMDPSSGVDNHTSNGGSDAFLIKFQAGNHAPTVATPAFASPNVVIGKSTTLHVLGADDAGEVNLTYTWTSVTAPVGAKLNYSANGTNAAKSTTVTFDRAGSYVFLVTITDADGLAVTSQTRVTVSQTLTDVVLTPFTGTLGAVTLQSGTTQQFTAWARDQFGKVLTTQPQFTWVLLSGGGTLSSTGVYTAPSSPTTAVIQATTNGVNGQVTVTVPNQAPKMAMPASASPSVVTGKSTTLQVLGADDGGEGNLTYTWTSVTAPAGAKLTYSANGTNAAKSTTVTFDRAGSYVFLVTITDAGGLSVTSQVSVIVSQTPTDVVLTPFTGALGTVTLQSGATQQFTAWARDQFGKVLTAQPQFTWVLLRGGGTLSSTGVYTAPSSSTTAVIQATTNGLKGQITVNVTATAEK